MIFIKIVKLINPFCQTEFKMNAKIALGRFVKKKKKD